MGRKRRRFTQEFKAKVALAAVRGEKTAAELASQFGMMASNISVSLVSGPRVVGRGFQR